MKGFQEILDDEIIREERLHEKGEAFLASSPKEALDIRQRKKGKTYYLSVDERRGKERVRHLVNINQNRQLIFLLAEKIVWKEVVHRCKSNLKLLRKVQKSYLSIESVDIKDNLPYKYREIFAQQRETMMHKLNALSYRKARCSAKTHIHETDCGIYVRSKSEQILLNTLYAHRIPFHYEEEFVYTVGNAGKIYPDITILLPNGEKIIWEHLGLLSNEEYCSRTAKKLNIYQLNGYTLGENLILTMDDNRGNFSSGTINRIIKQQILPYFK